MMSRTFRFAAAALALPAATALAAAPAPDCTDSGVWLGRIGKAPVSMAFSDGTGRYYYGGNVLDLVLTRDPSRPGRWLETDLHGKRTGTLTLACSDTLRGTWTAPNGERALPVAATPFAPDGATEPAADADAPSPDPEDTAVQAYLQARKANPPPVRRIDAHLGPHRYVRYGIHDFAAVSVELQGSEHGIARINDALRPKYAAALDGAWECRYWTLAQSGPQAAWDFVQGDRVVLWHGSTVVVESWSAGCARDSVVSTDEVVAYDTGTGQRATWPFPLSVDRDAPALMAEAARRYPGTDSGRQMGCAGFLDGKLLVTAWPEQDGLVVNLARAAGGKRRVDEPDPPQCDARLTLPYDTALPLLPDDRRKFLSELFAKP